MQLEPDLIAILKQAAYDPEANREYDLFAGGFCWSDEFPPAYWDACTRLGHVNRYLIGHRVTRILGQNDDRFLPIWQAVEQAVPMWPGLRPERRSTALAKDLLAQYRRDEKSLRRLERESRRDSP